MASIPQLSFAAGEISRDLRARADTALYHTALATCRNFRIMKTGGAENRAGTKFNAATKTAGQGLMLPFIKDSSTAYVLELGNGYMRFYKNGARIAVAGVAAWSGATTYAVGDLASRLGVNYYCILAHTNQQPPNATYWYALTTTIMEVPTPYGTADLAGLKIHQKADRATICSTGYQPRDLVCTGDQAWTFGLCSMDLPVNPPTSPVIGTYTAGADGTYVYRITSVNSNKEESDFSANTPGIPCVAPTQAAPNIVTWVAPAAGDAPVKYRVYLDIGNKQSYGFVGESTGLSFTDEGIHPDLAQTIDPANPFNAPFDTSGDYPACGCYYQQRQCFGGMSNTPASIKASRTALRKNFSRSYPLKDDDTVALELASNKTPNIRSMIGASALLALTSEGVYAVRGGDDGVLTPFDRTARLASAFGASVVAPVLAGDWIAYAQARGLKLIGLLDRGGAYSASDLNQLATHLFTKAATIARMTFQENPIPTVWVVTSAGTLRGLTWIPASEEGGGVLAWHRHDSNGDTIVDVCAIPEAGEDALYIMVDRNGGRYVERLATREIDTADSSTWVFLDSAVTYSGVAINSMTGLSHLDGETATALCDGSTVVTGTVVAGALALGANYTKVVAGLAIEADLETLDLDTSGGGLQGKTRNLNTVSVHIKEGLEFKAGPDSSHLKARPITSAERKGAVLFTGVIDATLLSQWNTSGRVFIRQAKPLPLTVLAVVPSAAVGG